MKSGAVIAIASLVIGAGYALADGIEKGEPAAPPNAKAVAGSYYCGDGTGYNVTLTLKDDSSYSAGWRGCLGNYGDASGTWKLSDKRVVLTPRMETGMMKGHLKVLDILKYKGGWIFVHPSRRELYGKYGVLDFSCFQKKVEE